MTSMCQACAGLNSDIMEYSDETGVDRHSACHGRKQRTGFLATKLIHENRSGSRELVS